MTTSFEEWSNLAKIFMKRSSLSKQIWLVLKLIYLSIVFEDIKKPMAWHELLQYWKSNSFLELCKFNKCLWLFQLGWWYNPTLHHKSLILINESEDTIIKYLQSFIDLVRGMIDFKAHLLWALRTGVQI
jgi:hypothetical protein